MGQKSGGRRAFLKIAASAATTLAGSGAAFGKTQLPITTKTSKPLVKLNDKPRCGGKPVDCQDLVKTIVALHNAWINQDMALYLSMCTEDVTRLSQRSGKFQYGQDLVEEWMREEWEQLERVARIAIRFVIRDLVISVDEETATVTYILDATGGIRWKFDNQALFFQAFVRSGGVWKLTHQADSWNLDLGNTAPSKLEFDVVYPVHNLSRALNFWQPLLGEPEFVIPNRAAFNLWGMRFYLDSTDLHGHAKILPGHPNGYTEIRVQNLREEIAIKKRKGVVFLSDLRKRGNDSYAVAIDPNQNVFVLVEHNYSLLSDGSPTDPVIHAGLSESKEIISLVRNFMGAWLRMDKSAMAKNARADIKWFDDTQSKNEHISSGLQSVQWINRDKGDKGLLANMAIDEFRVKSFGSRKIVSYQTTLRGTGEHPFRNTAMVTQVLDENLISHSFMMESNPRRGGAQSLDYVAHPAVRFSQSEKFYTNTMNFGDPYSDTDWRGYWSSASVYGFYQSDAKSGLARPKQTNCYASFWVKSAKDIYKYLRQTGSTFPLIWDITDKAGINPQPGYVGVFATDSEGNGVIFSEYP